MTHIHCWSISSLHSFRQTGNKHPVLSETHHGTKTALARVIGTFPSLNPVASSHLISPGLEATLDTAITPQTLTHFLHLATQVKNILHPFGFPPALLCYRCWNQVPQNSMTLSNTNVFSDSSGNQKSQVSGQGSLPSGGSGREAVFLPFPAVRAAWIPWFMAPASNCITRTSALMSLLLL